ECALVENDHHGKPIRARVPAGEKLLPLFGVCCVELERHPAARPQVPDLVRPCRPPLTDDAERHEPGAVCAGPLVQELRYDPVERLIGRMPRLDNVVVDLPERCRPQKGSLIALSPCDTSSTRLAPG